MLDHGNFYGAYETACELLKIKQYANAAEFFWCAEMLFECEYGDNLDYLGKIESIVIDCHRHRMLLEHKMEMFSLSKTSFVNGLQCSKYLWLYYNNRKQLKVSTDTQAKFDRGHKIGKLAQRLFPDGKSAEWTPVYSFESMHVPPSFKVPKIPYKITFNIWLENTRKMVAAKCDKSIYEAAFVYDKCFAAIDILEEKNGKFIAYEVKSMTEATDIVLFDCAYQYYVISHHIALSEFNLILLNPELQDVSLDGNVDVSQLFVVKSVLNEVKERQSFVEHKIEELQKVLKRFSRPIVVRGAQCDYPYECGFKDYCSGKE